MYAARTRFVLEPYVSHYRKRESERRKKRNRIYVHIWYEVHRCTFGGFHTVDRRWQHVSLIIVTRARACMCVRPSSGVQETVAGAHIRWPEKRRRAIGVMMVVAVRSCAMRRVTMMTVCWRDTRGKLTAGQSAAEATTHDTFCIVRVRERDEMMVFTMATDQIQNTDIMRY